MIKSKVKKSLGGCYLLTALALMVFFSCSFESAEIGDPAVNADQSIITRLDPDNYPTGFTVNIGLKSLLPPTVTSFTRYIRFENITHNTKDVECLFTRNSTNLRLFHGQITISGLNVLYSMTTYGNRSYWDKMYLVNKTGSVPLNINYIRVFIVYNNMKIFNYEDIDSDPIHTSFDYKAMEMAYAIDRYLGGPGSIVTIYKPGTIEEYLGPLEYANRLMGTNYHIGDFPKALRMFICDIGKNGTDPGKYGTLADGYMCSETVSWYYNEDLGNLGPYSFDGITGVNQLVNIFKNTGRFYCYHSGLHSFQKVDINGRWLTPYSSYKYIPKAGDYLARLTFENEHSMMILKWDDQEHIAWVMEGCQPVDIRRVPVQFWEDRDQDYAVGRVY
ncbi:MAG: hypothetical protein JW969_18310 [Spirochaetales bacterium]|nr:hypothetical protein [Spirochaetales bacterium]